MAQEVTTMVIKVDLACEKCSKKIKKVLCHIPYIQNQVYDEKANTVTITVKCCSPDKVKQKICCKGGKTVKGIEIVKPPPTKPKQKTAEPKPDKPLVVEVVVELPKPPTKKPKNPKDCPKRPPPVARCPPPLRCPSPPSCPSPPRCPSPPTCSPPPRCLPPPPPKCPSPPRCLPPPPPPCPPPPPVCCRECYEGVGVGPCWAGYGRPAGPCYYGRPVYDSWGCGYKRGYCKSRCTDYICEENPNACTTM